MTKKNFELIAQTLNENRPLSTSTGDQYMQWTLLVDSFIQKLRRTNPRFDSVRFRAACHGE